MKSITSVFLLLAVLVLPSAALAQQTYVLTARSWGAAQAAAVAAAGGTVVFGHDGAGVGVATSSAPDFASRVRASNAIMSVEEVSGRSVADADDDRRGGRGVQQPAERRQVLQQHPVGAASH